MLSNAIYNYYISFFTLRLRKTNLFKIKAPKTNNIALDIKKIAKSSNYLHLLVKNAKIKGVECLTPTRF